MFEQAGTQRRVIPQAVGASERRASGRMLQILIRGVIHQMLGRTPILQ